MQRRRSHWTEARREAPNGATQRKGPTGLKKKEPRKPGPSVTETGQAESDDGDRNRQTVQPD